MPPIQIGWVTWWPIPYWIDRFNALADEPDLRVHVHFLTAGSTQLPLSVRGQEWRFQYRFLSNRASGGGYYRLRWSVPNIGPILSTPVDRLVLFYADPTPIAAAVVSRLLRRPYFVFATSTRADHRETRWWKERLKAAMFSGAAGILATGPLQSDYASAYVRDGSRIHVVGNPVADLSAKHPIDRHRARIELGRGRPVVLFVGRLAPEKGIDVLLGAMARLRQNDGIDALLLLVGDGPEKQALEQMSSALNVEARFLGMLEGDDLANCYAAADVFVLPSRSEPWGLVVNEALQFGLPVLVSDCVGSAPRLVRNDVNGYTFPAGDAATLQRQLRHLLTRPEVREAFGRRGREIAEENSIPQWVKAVRHALAC